MVAGSFQPRKLAIDVQVLSDAPAYLNELFPINIAVKSNDTVDVRVSIDAMLQTAAGKPEDIPTDSLRLQTIGDSHQNLSGHVITERLAAGSSETITLFLHTAQAPGLRSIETSVVCKPLAEQSKVATTEIARRIQLEAVHPFFCDFRAEWSRMPSAEHKPASLLNLEAPDPWIGSIKLLLDITTGGLGPVDVTVEGIKLTLAVSAFASPTRDSGLT